MARRRSDRRLDEARPDLVPQLLTPFDPHLLSEHSDEVVLWRGPLGHVWRASVADRVAGRDCPVCTGLRPPERGRSLAAANPEAAMDADGWNPELASAGSRAEMPWRCHHCGTTWSAEIRARARGHRACPTCEREQRPPLSVTHPDLAAEMQPPFDPAHYTYASKAKVMWRGPAGHVWEATVANRTKGSGCPTCARERRRIASHGQG